MKALRYLAIFLISATSMFMSLSRRQQNNDLNPIPGIASTATDETTWDQKNRRSVNSMFFIEIPAWMRDSHRKPTPDPANESSQPVSSGVQTNPFFE